ncbi:hypothetical protein L6259_00980 [Candidatus Parcubacteria bacterium]|nr:hypothetical protein [Patescibacteria group bacterium]MCG2693846.1 hypothetical protein [Candidatus Parcubacteria bacterium]
MIRRKRIILYLILTIAISQAVFFGFLAYFNLKGAIKKAEFGVTFSPGQAYYLGLDPKEVLHASLTDLGIKKYRLSAYWDKVEEKQGKYDFSQIDWQIDEVSKEGGEIILAVGRRLPRWPECHDPAWIKGLPEEKIQENVLALVEKTIERYKSSPAIKAWQVENEPFLSIFGECPAPDPEFLKKEIALVRSLDNRPIALTASGELSSWTNEALLADKVGVSLYRTTWNSILGMFYYPLTPHYYKSRANTLRLLGKEVFVSELQAEPWERQPLPQTPLIEQKELMNEKMLSSSVKFAKRAGFDEIYLWGAEWWYWLKNQGDDGMWQTVKKIVQEN